MMALEIMLNGLLLLAIVLGFIAWRAFRKPRGVYLRSAIGVAGVTLGWAAIWFAASPANEAGFGFFAIWIVLVAIALAAGLAASLGATARYIANAAFAEAG